MRKKLFSLGALFLVLAALLIGNVFTASARSGWKVYTDEDRGFSVQYPAEWNVSQGNQHAPNLPEDLLTFSSQRGVFDMTVVPLENDLGLSPADLAYRAFAGHFGPFDVVSGEHREVNGFPALRVIHSQPEIEGTVVRYISTFIQRDKITYWLFTQLATNPRTGEPASSTLETRVRLYEEVVNSLVCLPQGPRKPLRRMSAVPVPPERPSSAPADEHITSTFVWPSTGYLGYLYGRDGHLAIDVWTRTDGGGNDGSRGNPIYSVATGTVYTIFDDGDGVAMVVGIQHSGLGLWTWYWHMADEYNPVSFIDPSLYIGQPVTSNTYLGDQGNRRWQGMYDIIVHLHFGLSNVPYSQNQYGLDPSPYFDLALNWNDPDHLPWHYYVERPDGCCGCGKLGAGEQQDVWVSAAQAAASPSGSVDSPDLVPLVDPPALDDTLVEPDPSLPSQETVLTETVSLDELDSVASPVAHAPVEPQRTPPASASFRISRSVFGSGGGEKTSTHYVMNSTQGQSTDLRRRHSAGYVLVSGYWSRWIPPTFEYGIYLPLVVKGH